MSRAVDDAVRAVTAALETVTDSRKMSKGAYLEVLEELRDDIQDRIQLTKSELAAEEG